MPDVGGPPSITLLQAVLTFSGVLLAPVMGTIAGLLSRSGLQRKQQEAEYKIKRLDLIEKAISVGRSVSNTLLVDIDVSFAQAEYLRVLNSLSEPEPPSEQDLLPFERYKLPIRLLILPKPTSISGWISSFFFYIYLICGIFYLMFGILTLTVPSLSVRAEEAPAREVDLMGLSIGGVIASLAICAVARFWAIRAAKATIRRDREKFRREIGPEGIPPAAHT